MHPLRRHRLVRLTTDGWSSVIADSSGSDSRSLLTHWASRALPLVVTRQPDRVAPGDADIALGLPAPLAWERRRIALAVPRHAILQFGDFPEAAEVADELPATSRLNYRAAVRTLEATGALPRAYGSFGWQSITRLPYVHERSDMDWWVEVTHAAQADAAAAAMNAADIPGMRLDGELIFPDGGAVAWREWASWRAGAASGVLVKRLQGVSIEHVLPAAWHTAPSRAAAGGHDSSPRIWA